MRATRSRDNNNPGSPRQGQLHVPLDGVTAGRLQFTSGVEDVTLTADDAIADLIQARFLGQVPVVTAVSGTIRVHYRRTLGWSWRAKPATFQLNPVVPWNIEIDGGVQRLEARLRDVRLAGLSVSGGASRVTLELPPATQAAGRRAVPVSLIFTKGVSDLTVLRPAGTPVRLSVHGGASHARLDDQVMGAVGGPLQWHTAGDSSADGRYDITVHGGASRITVGVAG